MVQSGLWTTLFSTPVQTLNSGCVDTLYVESMFWPQMQHQPHSTLHKIFLELLFNDSDLKI